MIKIIRRTGEGINTPEFSAVLNGLYVSIGFCDFYRIEIEEVLKVYGEKRFEIHIILHDINRINMDELLKLFKLLDGYKFALVIIHTMGFYDCDEVESFFSEYDIKNTIILKEDETEIMFEDFGNFMYENVTGDYNIQFRVKADVGSNCIYLTTYDRITQGIIDNNCKTRESNTYKIISKDKSKFDRSIRKGMNTR